VACDAKSHFELGILQPIHGFHLSVALFAHDLPPDVPFMVEKDMLWKVIDLDPRRGCLGIEIVMFFLYLRVISNDVFVTVKAFFHSRNPRVRGAAHIRVTELALDLLHPRVDPVAEGNRLLRPQVFERHEVKKVKAGCDDSRAAEDHQDG